MSRTKKELEILAECRGLKKKHPKLKRKKLDKIKDLEKRLYYHKVWAITESQPLHKLRNFKKRGLKSYHLDHIFPISVGFYEKVSPEIIGNIKNIRFIKAEYNMKKSYKVTQTARTIINEIKKSRNT